jgi:hypothetical protein
MSIETEVAELRTATTELLEVCIPLRYDTLALITTAVNATANDMLIPLATISANAISTQTAISLFINT